MHFEIISKLESTETIARGTGIRELKRIKRFYGPGQWRKRKGVATIKYENGAVLMLSYTGTKPLVLENVNLRSNDYWINNVKTEICNLY